MMIAPAEERRRQVANIQGHRAKLFHWKPWSAHRKNIVIRGWQHAACGVHVVPSALAFDLQLLVKSTHNSLSWALTKCISCPLGSSSRKIQRQSTCLHVLYKERLCAYLADITWWNHWRNSHRKSQTCPYLSESFWKLNSELRNLYRHSAHTE